MNHHDLLYGQIIWKSRGICDRVPPTVQRSPETAANSPFTLGFFSNVHRGVLQADHAWGYVPHSREEQPVSLAVAFF